MCTVPPYEHTIKESLEDAESLHHQHQVREQLEQSIKMTMQTMEFFSEISESGGPWSLTRNVMSVGPGPSISKNDITLSLPPDMVKYTKLSQLSRLPDPPPLRIGMHQKLFF
jgi:hypothetical protein